MKILVDPETVYVVDWKHEKYSSPLGGVHSIPIRTICIVRKIEPNQKLVGKTPFYAPTEYFGTDIFRGLATCSIKDQFNKNSGRKISLTRAIKTLPKYHRKTIWDKYNKEIGYRYFKTQ
jgi:hypothetical protein